MSEVAIQPLTGTYHAVPTASTFAFAVRHSGVFRFRGSLSDVTATLRADGDTLALVGTARVDSISVSEPEAMRASVLGDAFFDAEHHPELTFRSTAVDLVGADGLEVYGELTMRGITRPVTATGRYGAPRQAGFGEVAGMQLHTCIDRRDFGFDWQAEMPAGGDALGWDVDLEIDLLLVREVAES
jgi:polyisoprenoid-binding protein YceI